MSEKEHTPEQKRWLAMREKIRSGDDADYYVFRNLALNMNGDMCIGMSYSVEWQRYSCTHTDRNGVRDFGGSYRWDKNGISLDGDIDLNMKTVQQGIRKV